MKSNIKYIALPITFVILILTDLQAKAEEGPSQGGVQMEELLALTVVCIIGIAVITTFFYDRRKRSREIKNQSKK